MCRMLTRKNVFLKRGTQIEGIVRVKKKIENRRPRICNENSVVGKQKDPSPTIFESMRNKSPNRQDPKELPYTYTFHRFLASSKQNQNKIASVQFPKSFSHVNYTRMQSTVSLFTSTYILTLHDNRSFHFRRCAIPIPPQCRFIFSISIENASVY